MPQTSLPTTDKTLQAADGAQIRYRFYGEGPKLITVLHSLALDGTWYEPLAAALGPEYRLLAPDFRGHGASTLGSSGISLRQTAQDIAAIWDAEGIERSVIMGISLGGMVAQALTGLYPQRVDAQILMATRGAYDDAARTATGARAAEVRAENGLQQVDEATMFRWFGERSADRSHPLVQRASAQFLGAGGEVIGAWFEAMTAVGDFALPSPPPTLVVAGGDDRSTPRPVIEALAASIPGARLVVAHGGHLVAFETPQEAVAAVRPFLESLPSLRTA